jgi:hypothetical protein
MMAAILTGLAVAGILIVRGTGNRPEPKPVPVRVKTRDRR